MLCDWYDAGEAIEIELQSQERAHRQRLRDLTAEEEADIEKQRSQLGNKVGAVCVKIFGGCCVCV
jgi:hypothetical protein